MPSFLVHKLSPQDLKTKMGYIQTHNVKNKIFTPLPKGTTSNFRRKSVTGLTMQIRKHKNLVRLDGNFKMVHVPAFCRIFFEVSLCQILQNCTW